MRGEQVERPPAEEVEALGAWRAGCGVVTGACLVGMGFMFPGPIWVQVALGVFGGLLVVEVLRVTFLNRFQQVGELRPDGAHAAEVGEDSGIDVVEGGLGSTGVERGEAGGRATRFAESRLEGEDRHAEPAGAGGEVTADVAEVGMAALEASSAEASESVTVRVDRPVAEEFEGEAPDPGSADAERDEGEPAPRGVLARAFSPRAEAWWRVGLGAFMVVVASLAGWPSWYRMLAAFLGLLMVSWGVFTGGPRERPAPVQGADLAESDGDEVVPHADRRPWYVDRPWPSFAHTGCLLPLAVLFFATSFVTGESWFARVGMLVPSGLYLVWWALGVTAGVIRDARGIPHPERSERPRRTTATEQRSTTEQRIMTERRITEVVERHAATLRRKRRQLIRVDDYGNVFADAWEREMDYFVANVVARALGSGLSFQDREYARQEVVRVARALDDRFDGVDVASMSPIEYEHYCADLLRRAGWDARVTSASGDQGVDIVATRGGRTLVVQAKRYSGSVGNAAVQEVLAGKQFMGADLAAVVSPAPFTRSAVELANVTGVRLVHHEQLADL